MARINTEAPASPETGVSATAAPATDAPAPSAPTPGTLAETQAAVGTVPPVDTTTDVDRPPLKELSQVKYIGIADRRTISVPEFAQASVEAKQDLDWNRSNSWTISTSLMNAATVDYLSHFPEEFQVS